MAAIPNVRICRAVHIYQPDDGGIERPHIRMCGFVHKYQHYGYGTGMPHVRIVGFVHIHELDDDELGRHCAQLST